MDRKATIASCCRRLCRHLRLLVMLSIATWGVEWACVHAKDASSLPLWDDPQACEWDVKICADGTWVYPDAALGCAFPECWVKFQGSTPDPFIYSADV